MDNKSNMFFSGFDTQLRDIFFKDIDKHNILAYIIYTTNYTESPYKDLATNQCYFTYATVERVTGVNKSKIQRVMKELEEEGFISWIYKSKTRHKESILELKNRYSKQYSNQYSNDNSNQYSKPIENTGLDGVNDTVNDTVNDIVSDTVNDTLSIYISKNKSINNSNMYICEEGKKKSIPGIGVQKSINQTEEYIYINDMDHVNITESQYNKLVNKYGEELTMCKITLLDERISNGKRYKDHYKTLRSWCSKENLYPKPVKEIGFNNFKSREYNYAELEKQLTSWY